MAQGGCPEGSGRGGPGYQFADELPPAGRYEIGSLAMANAGPNTNGSQFFIISGQDGVRLPPLYSLFGQVIKGIHRGRSSIRVRTIARTIHHDHQDRIRDAKPDVTDAEMTPRFLIRPNLLPMGVGQILSLSHRRGAAKRRVRVPASQVLPEEAASFLRECCGDQ
jgi:cyclophilin family peptidyl-prolyl cis-trans isomerase